MDFLTSVRTAACGDETPRSSTRPRGAAPARLGKSANLADLANSYLGRSRVAFRPHMRLRPRRAVTVRADSPRMPSEAAPGGR
jgi:hypothetical protein